MLATALKTGTIYKEGGAPLLVTKYEHVKTARSGATVKVKTKNLITGQALAKSYSGNTKVEDADVVRKNAQYLYRDGGFVFMDPDTYDQFTIGKDVIGDNSKFLLEGEKVQVLYFEDSPVSISLPISMTFSVKYTEPGHRGNSATNVFKDAELDNGTRIKVPLFTKIGDKIKVNTQTGEYASKA
jgi:elongation factor P